MDPLVTWLLAGLAVAVLVGVAVVAAGHGEPLADAEEDVPPSGVPESGPLTADDLRRVRFPLALRGYRMADVDALLDRLAAQVEQQAENGSGGTPGARGADQPAPGDRGHEGEH